MAKRFLYKVYTKAGVFLSTWADVASDLKFKTAIMSGIGEFVVELPRRISSFGELSDVNFQNIVRVYVFDEDAPTGTLVASGHITKYTPTVEGPEEKVIVTCLGFLHELADYPYVESGDTRITKSTTDPSNMAKAVLDAFTAAGGIVDYNGGSVDLTGLSETYVFNAMSCLEALKKVLELCPSSWYWYVGADNIFYLKAKAATAAHTLTLGKGVTGLKAEKNTESIVNRIYFTGGDIGGGVNFYKVYNATTSQSEWGLKAIFKQDERITLEATADAIADAILDARSVPEIRMIVKVADGNGNDFGYDIESLKPGDTVFLRNIVDQNFAQWDVAFWDQAYWDGSPANVQELLAQIQSVTYTPDAAIIELSNRPPRIPDTIEQIERDLKASATLANPDAPTS